MEETRAQQIMKEAREADNKAERVARSDSSDTQEELNVIDSNPMMELDVQEVRKHSRGGWRMGLLIARNVNNDYGTGAKPWEDEGISQATWYRRRADKTDYSQSVLSKTSARAFSIRVGTMGKDTVDRYLAAWNLAAADGLFVSSSNLSPGDEISFDDVDENNKEIFTPTLWEKYYKAASGKEKDEEKKDLKSLYNKIKTFFDVEISEWLNEDVVNVKSDKTLNEILEVIQGGRTKLDLWETEIISYAESKELTT